MIRFRLIPFAPLAFAACKPGELLRFRRNLANRFAIGVEDDRRYQSFGDRDSHRKMYAVEMPDVITHPPGIHLGMIGKGVRDCLQHDVVVADLVVVAKLFQLSTHL